MDPIAVITVHEAEVSTTSAPHLLFKKKGVLSDMQRRQHHGISCLILGFQQENCVARKRIAIAASASTLEATARLLSKKGGTTYSLKTPQTSVAGSEAGYKH